TLAEWFADEALRLYQTLRETEAEREQRSLLEWIAGRGGQTTPRHLRNSCCGRYPTVDAAETALNDLVAAGLGEWGVKEASPQGGRPSSTFHLCAHETPENSGDDEVSWAHETERDPGEEG